MPGEKITEFDIYQRIAGMGLTADFQERSKRMGFTTLNDICTTPPQELVKKEGFSYRWLEELSGYLVRNGKLDLLQAIPGKNYG